MHIQTRTLLLLIGLAITFGAIVETSDAETGAPTGFLWPTTDNTVKAFRTLGDGRQPRTAAGIRKALDLTDWVINSYKQAALARQEEIEQAVKSGKMAPPAENQVSERVFRQVAGPNGVLNDVAACFYLRGEARRANHEFTLAAQAYKAGARLTMARVWDPGPDPRKRDKGWNSEGIFWSPAKVCRYRLADMVEKGEITKAQAQVP